MKHYLIGTLVMLLTACIGTGDNSDIKPQGKNQFPLLTGIDLLGEERPIPASFAGHLNLVAVAFEREQQEDVNTWIPTAEQLMQQHAHLRFYEVPLIYEMNAAMRGWINNGMRAGIEEKAARERTITVYTDRDQFTSLMNMQTKSIYLLLLDKKGTILWRHEGVWTKTAYQSLVTKIEEHSRAS